jgi:hypothetical protein
LAKLNDYGPLRDLREQTGLAGEGGTFRKVLQKVFGSKPNPAMEDNLFAAEASANLDNPAEARALADKAEEALRGPGTTTVGQALKIRRAIDQFTPRGAFADTATGVEAQTKNTVADGLRQIIGDNAPSIQPELKNEQALITLQNALKAYDHAKARGIPGTTGSFLQRTLLTPALATPAAGAGYKAGQSLTAAQQNAIVQALKRVGRVGGISALGKF